MIRRRETTSAEDIGAHLARIEEVNPTVNAVTVTLAKARSAAGIDPHVRAGIDRAAGWPTPATKSSKPSRRGSPRPPRRGST